MLALGVACTVAAVAWVYLAVGHGGYWRTSQWLPSASVRSPLGEPPPWPGVVAVIPARNEAVMLPAVLPTLLGQDYPGPLTVIVVDDCSSDGTAEVAAELGPQPGPGPRALRVVAGSPLPPGWAGKVWAMAQGLDAAGLPPGPPAADADPDPEGPGYVLFTDADIAWDAGALRALVSAAESDDRDLVSQMALLRTATPWERIVVPAFVYFFAQLYPFPRVNAPGSRTAAAAGGCMLVRTEALSRSGGLAPIHGARIDDVAFGRMIKRQRGRCWLGLSTRVVSVRPYPRLADLWRMVSRSAYIQLNYSPWLLAATIAGLLFLYALPPAGAIIGLAALGGLWPGAATGPAALAAGAGLAGWAFMSLTYLPVLRLYRLSPLRAPGLPLIAMLYAAMTVDSARRHYAGRGAEWKGRTDRARLRWPGYAGPVADTVADTPAAARLWADEPEAGGWRRYLVADVFTATPLEGNQLAVFPDGRGLDDDLMQRTAREMNLSETVFFRPAEQHGDVRVRIFTPASELPFAGHPVLGSAFVLGQVMGAARVVLETGAGPVPVELERDGDRIVFGRMEQPIPVAEPYQHAAELLAALGVPHSGLPVEAYRNGPRHVYVELASEAEVAGLRPDHRALAALEIGVSTFAGRGLAWKTRTFAPFHGVPEDPATGSAAGPLAVHLARHGRIGFGDEIEIRQGEEIGRPSRLYARAEGSADRIERVLVGGSAVIVARGQYRLG